MNAEETEAADTPTEGSTLRNLPPGNLLPKKPHRTKTPPPTPSPRWMKRWAPPSLGVPHKLRRTSKVDEILAAAKDVALQAFRKSPRHTLSAWCTTCAPRKSV